MKSHDDVATGESTEKAGAYAIEGMASRWVERIDGCYFNVVGLPVPRLYRMLSRGEDAAACSCAWRPARRWSTPTVASWSRSPRGPAHARGRGHPVAAGRAARVPPLVHVIDARTSVRSVSAGRRRRLDRCRPACTERCCDSSGCCRRRPDECSCASCPVVHGRRHLPDRAGRRARPAGPPGLPRAVGGARRPARPRRGPGAGGTARDPRGGRAWPSSWWASRPPWSIPVRRRVDLVFRARLVRRGRRRRGAPHLAGDLPGGVVPPRRAARAAGRDGPGAGRPGPRRHRRRRPRR